MTTSKNFVLQQLLEHAHEYDNGYGKVKYYIENNQIPLNIFAEFVHTFKNDLSPDATQWGSFRNDCILTYFQSSGGKKAIEAFIKQGCQNDETVKMIEDLLYMHPRSEVSNGDKKEENMSPDEKLLWTAFNKIWSIQKTSQFQKATVEGIKGKWKKTEPDYNEQAKQIADKWKTPQREI